MSGAALLLPFLVMVWYEVWQLRKDLEKWRNQDLGHDLIDEAHKVKSIYPDEYHTYRAEAVKALARLGLGHLVERLPEVDGD